jgi:hypothetical protein
VLEAKRGVSPYQEGVYYIVIHEHVDEYVQKSGRYREAVETTWTRRMRPHMGDMKRQTVLLGRFFLLYRGAER